MRRRGCTLWLSLTLCCLASCSGPAANLPAPHAARPPLASVPGQRSTEQGPLAPSRGAPREDRFAPSFQVRVSGRGSLLVVIPGLGCSGSLFEALVRHYEDSYEVHVLTLAGFAGVPPRGEAAPIATARQELERYLEGLGKGPAVVLGHSLGGFLAYWIAGTRPDLVSAVVSLDGVPFLPALFDDRATAESSKQAGAAVATQIARVPPDSYERVNAANVRAMIPEPELAARVAAASERSDPRTVGAAYEEMWSTDLRALMASVQAPVLLLVGTRGNDTPTVRRAYEKEMSASPRHRVVFTPAGGHFLFLEAPAAVVDVIDSFFRDFGPGSRRQ